MIKRPTIDADYVCELRQKQPGFFKEYQIVHYCNGRWKHENARPDEEEIFEVAKCLQRRYTSLLVIDTRDPQNPKILSHCDWT